MYREMNRVLLQFKFLTLYAVTVSVHRSQRTTKKQFSLQSFFALPIFSSTRQNVRSNRVLARTGGVPNRIQNRADKTSAEIKKNFCINFHVPKILYDVICLFSLSFTGFRGWRLTCFFCLLQYTLLYIFLIYSKFLKIFSIYTSSKNCTRNLCTFDVN